MIKNKKQNILVTGASGFVGGVLVEKLLKSNDNLFLVSQDKKYKVSNSTVFYGDFNDEKFCKKIVKNIDTVYYLAGYKKNISYHTKYPNDFIVGNTLPLISFLNAVKQSNIKKIIYLSSTHVGLYTDGEKDGYIIGKYINELILKSFATQFDIDVKIVRSAPIYGPGDNFNLETANFIPSMISKVSKEDKEIVVWGSGKRKLQFIYIDDLVSNLISISSSKLNFFVVGNPEVLNINNIVKKIVGVFGKNLKIKHDLTKPDKESVLFRFNNNLPFLFDFDTGLENTINYYRRRRARVMRKQSFSLPSRGERKEI